MNAYAEIFKRHRWLIALLVVGATILAGTSIPSLRTSDNVWDLFMEKGPEPTNSNVNDNICLIELTSDELFTPDGMSVIRDLHQSLSETDGVERITSLYDIRKPYVTLRRRIYRRMFPGEDADTEEIEEFRQLVAEHPMVRDQILTDDSRSTLIIAELNSEFRSSVELRPVIDQIERLVQERISDEPFSVDITGPTVVQVRAADALVKDQLIFNLAGPVMAIVIAFILFRRFSAVIIVTLAPILGVAWVLGWFALMGEELNPINGVVAPLVLTIGLTDAVHMLLHIKHQIAKGLSPLDAAVDAIRQVGAACLLTSLTTAIGFASLSIADFQLLRDFGVDCAAGVILAFIAVVTIVPLLGSTALGRKTVRSQDIDRDTDSSRHRLAGRWYSAVVRFSIRNRSAVCIVGTVATIALVLLARNLELDVRVQRGLPNGTSAQQAFLDVDERFRGSLPFMIVIEWIPGETPDPDEFVDVVKATNETLKYSEINSSPLSVLSIFEIMPGQDRSPKRLVGELETIPDDRLAIFYDEEQGYTRIIARFQDVGSDQIELLLDEIDQRLAELSERYPEYRFVIPNSPPTGLRSASGILFDLVDSLFLAVPVTIMIIMLVLRSIRLGLISLLPNVFPMAALAATMLVFDIPLQLTGATVFVMCFGIAVDDTIHALVVYQRLTKEGVPPLDAIERGFLEIGDAIISTTIILIAGISVVMLGQSVMTLFFGGLFIVGLIWAFIGDLLLLPATLACFAPKSPVKEVSND